MPAEPMRSDPTTADDVQDIKGEVVEGEPVTSTPPTSPLQVQMAQKKAMPPPSAPASTSRKRSSDEMHGESRSTASSNTTGGEFAQLAQGKDNGSTDTANMKRSDSQPNMKASDSQQEIKVSESQSDSQMQMRQAKPFSNASGNAATASSQQLPPSGQGSQNPRSKSAKAIKAESQAAANDASSSDDSDESDDSDQTDPQVPIQAFDWDNLTQRYHDRMSEFDEEERRILNDFMKLVDYFQVWADVGSRKEVDRSFKRLKTQSTYVKHEEYQLEQKRLHYIKVVEAFKSALELLNR